MNLETTASNLRAALDAVAGVIERRSTIPVLRTVRISNDGIVATNLDTEVSVKLPTTGKVEGDTAIDYFRLSALAKHIAADEPISIEDKDHLASITFNGSAYTLPSLPASDFPEFDDISGERTEIGNAGLIAAFRRVRFAVSTEETRYYLNGIAFVEAPDGGAIVAATDGHRLATLPLPFMPTGAKGQIVPKDLVSYLCGRKVEPKAVTFQTDKSRAKLEYDGLTVAAKLIDRTYPDIFRVIPKNPVHHFSCNRAPLLATLRRMAAFAASSEHERRGVKISGADGELTLSIGRVGSDFASETVQAECSEPFEVGYNARYLIDALSALTGDTASIGAEESQIAGAPAIITSNDDPLRVLLMPMRV